MALTKQLIPNPSHKQLQQAGYTWDETTQNYLKGGIPWAGEPVETYGQAATEGEYLVRTAAIKEEHGGFLFEQPTPPTLAAPITPKPVVPETAPEDSLPEGWNWDESGNAVNESGLKITPDKHYIMPDKVSVDEFGVETTEKGKVYTEAEIKENNELLTSLGELFPDQDIQQLMLHAEFNPSMFVQSFQEVGDTAASRAMLKRMNLPDEAIDAIFYPQAEISKSPFALLGAAWQNFINTKILAKPTANIEFAPGSSNVWKDLYQVPGKLMEWLAPTKVGAALGVVGGFFENVINRPWETTVILASDMVAQAISKGITGAELPITKSDQILADAQQKYGAGFFFSDEVAESWNIYKEELPSGVRWVATAEEWLNPAYFIPIGGGLGKAASFTSKIPIIGKALKYAAAGTQAIEKGMALPLTVPLKMGLAGLEEVGIRIGEAATNQLIKQSRHLEDIMDLPTSEKILDATLQDNWQKRALMTLAKVPPIKAGLEKGLGWRVLTPRVGDEVMDAVGRGAIVHSEMTRRGANAAAAKLLELRATISNPVKFFGFDENAISAKMAERINPYYRGIPEAGTLEHIFAKPQLYNWTGMEEGLRYVQKFQEVQDVMYNLLVKEGVPPEHVIEDWVHRVVQDTGKVKGAPKVGGGGGRIGTKPTYEKPRRFTTMADGIKYFAEHPELGKAYANNPELLIRDYIRQAFKKIADNRFEQYVAGWGLTIKEIMAYRFPEEVAAWQLRPVGERLATKYIPPTVARIELTVEEEALLKEITQNEGVGISEGVRSFWGKGIGTTEAHSLVLDSGAIEASIRLEGLSEQQIKLLENLQKTGEIDFVYKPDFPLSPYTEVRIAGDTQIDIAQQFTNIADTLAAPKIPEVAPKVGATIREQVADLGYALSIIKRIGRGEIPPGATLAAIERRTPDIGKAINDLLAMSPERFDKELANLSKDVWQQLKITSAEFKQTLIKIRNRPITVGDPVRASEIDQTFAWYNVANKDRLKMLTQLYKETYKAKFAEIKAFSKTVSVSLESLKPEWWKAKTAYTKAAELAKQPSIGMGYLPEPFAGGKIYTQDFIQAFNKYFEKQGGIGTFKVVSEMSSILRTTKAALDASAMAIQGMPSFGLAFSHLFWNPIEGMKMMGGWFKGFGMSAAVYLDKGIAARYIEKNSASIMQRLSFGGSEMVSDYLINAESRLTEKLMAKLPIYDRANLSFCTATEVVRDEFWKILSPKAIEQGYGKAAELARSLDRITGTFNSEAAGIPLTVKQIENSFVWFAPNYTRACLTVLSDIFRGGYTGAMARKAIGGMIAGGAIMYSGVQYAMSTLQGKTDEQAKEDVLAGFGVTTDPITGETTWKISAQFMSIKVGNYNMGFGGFWYGLLRLGSNIAYSMEKLGEAADNDRLDLITILKGGGEGWLDNPFIKWWYGRSSPIVGTAFELISGKDYFGYPIETPMDYAKYIITRFEPIWAEQGINPWIPGLAKANEVPEGAARAAVIPAEFFGMRTFPESSWVKFYDKGEEIINKLPEDLLAPYFPGEGELAKILEAQRQGKLEWGMLPGGSGGLQSKLLGMYPELNKLYGEAQTDSLMRDSLPWQQWTTQMTAEKTQNKNRLRELMDLYGEGKLTGQQRRDAKSQEGERYGTALLTMEVFKGYETVYAVLNAKNQSGDKYDWYYQRATDEYNNIINANYEDADGFFDWDLRQAAIDGFIEKYGHTVYETIKSAKYEKKLNEGYDPRIIQESKDVETLQPYWELPYKAISTMTQKDFDDGKIPAQYVSLWQQYQTLTTDAEKTAFKEAHPEFAKDWKAEYRVSNPEMDATLALWGYGGKLQSKKAYDILAKKATELGFDIDKMDLGLPPQSLIKNYFDYNALTDSTERKQYRKANPLFDEWGQAEYGWTDIDTQKIPTPIPSEIQKYYDAYNKLPLGNARKQYRVNNPDFDAWLVKEKGYKPAKAPKAK